MSSPRSAKISSLHPRATATLVVVGAMGLAVLAAGGTYALLNSSTSIGSAASITSGTAALTVSPLTMSTAVLYPGLTTYGAATVTNTGDVPLSVRITGLTSPTATTPFSQSLTIGGGIVASPAACSSGTFTPGWAGPFPSATTAVVGSVLAAGSSATFCVSVTMALTAAPGSQGQSATNFGILIDGIQS
ncbi:hypothetical protein SAMN05216282_108139 [Cryobacterium psychrotolerans]|uniref:SipW-cognate class signal peptide n=1 Tax=Cryobacterium psychrotolerans TaxID=386301 RepID=A0A1G9DAS3_9MICO|nr:hypothetical protein SAMN05216282_108139 [Cryobacterium psychrotolerans]